MFTWQQRLQNGTQWPEDKTKFGTLDWIATALGSNPPAEPSEDNRPQHNADAR